MSDHAAKAQAFRALHQPGKPLVLYNIWDPGSAKVVAEAGAKALATGSYSVASAFGFEDGETTPLEVVLDNCRRITAAVDLPVTLDFESGYALDADGLKRNIEAVIAAGAVGINFEDGIVGGGLHPLDAQAARMAVVRAAADQAGPGFFINARCDLFLQADRATHGPAMLAEWLERAKAYADAGADGVFAPGLVHAEMIGELAGKTPRPLNIMMMNGAPDVAALGALGVARVSYGGGPYRVAMQALAAGAKALYGA